MTQIRSDNDSISAVLDGECAGDELSRLLKRLGSDSEARQRLGRYSLARDAIRGDLSVGLSAGFADRISAAIEREPTLLAPRAVAPAAPEAPTRRWMRPAAGLAIAASVAMVSFIGLDQLRQDPAKPSAVAVATAPVVLPAQSARTAPVGLMQTSVAGAGQRETPNGNRLTRVGPGQIELQNRLNAYLLDHTEHARMAEMNGMLSYPRLVGYDRSQ